MNKYKRIFFSKPTILLDQFNEYVEEKRLKRLPYATWRALKIFFTKAEVNNCDIGIETDTMNNILMGTSQMDIGNYDPEIWDGEIFGGDGSFGDFVSHFLQGDDIPWRDSKPILVSNSISDVAIPSYLASVGTDCNTCATAIGSVSNAINSLKETWTSGVAFASTGNNVVIDGDLIVKGKIINENTDKERESNNMKFNFDFGTCENDNVRVSPYGIAIKNADSTWVSYDAKSGNLVDVDIFNFDGGKYLFKMPVAVKDIKVGDTVIHNRVPVYVVSVGGGDITVIDPRAGDKKTILPLTNMFGFNFVTKVVSLLDGAFNTATPDSPFGNMLPFFLMSNSDNKKNSVDPLMMAMLLNGNAASGLNNPMLLALMCGDQADMRDVLPLMMLAGQGNPLTPAGK